MKDQVGHGRLWRKAIFAGFGAAFLLFSSAAYAVSLGKIEVASSLTQPLYAEVPLNLESNELASKVFIEIASSADYKIFEVYRDPILDSIRADVASDVRGTRVELSSRIGIETPYFNLVLKVRYGRVSHFKKYAIFLDTDQAVERIVQKEPVPQVEAVAIVKPASPEVSSLSSSQTPSKLTESAGNALISEQVMAAKKQLEALQRKALELERQSLATTAPKNWARVKDKYGPIVRGDSLSVVAQRLRVDGRYSTNQIMVSLFDNNKPSFEQENMNLLKTGSFLQIPSGAEVETHSKLEAFYVAAKHETAWKQMPKYAIEAEVQRTRFTNRVRIGEQTDDHAMDSVISPLAVTQDLLKPLQDDIASLTAAVKNDVMSGMEVIEAVEGRISPQLEKMMQVQAETNQLLAALQQKNADLQEQLIANKDSVDGLRAKVNESTMAAADARFDKMELLLTRLQAQLEMQGRKAVVQQFTNDADWVTWILLSLLIIMLAVVAMLLRRGPGQSTSTQAEKPEAEIEPELLPAVEAEPETLEEVVEEAIENLEIDKHATSSDKASGSLDFSDDLSDTDTAEFEAFDVDARQAVDPNIDYLSEADVYIRYGMEDEALQQLDMALRVNSKNAEAHLKKAQLLHGKNDKHAYGAAIAVATASLAAVELEQFRDSVEAFGGDIEVVAAEAPVVEALAVETPVAVEIDDESMGDFDLSGLDVAGVDVEVHRDVSKSVSSPNVETKDAEINTPEVEKSEEADELDWLSDPMLAGDEDIQADIQIETLPTEKTMLEDTKNMNEGFGELSVEPNSVTLADADTFSFEETEAVGSLEKTIELEVEDDGVQELGGLLSEFSQQDELADDLPVVDLTDATEATIDIEDDGVQELGGLLSEFTLQDDLGADDLVMATSDKADSPLDFEDAGVQELGGLLSEFTEQDELEVESAKHAEPAAELEESFAVGGLDHLDDLLNKFSDDDDDLGFSAANGITTTEDDFDVAIIEQGKVTSSLDVMDTAMDLDLDHGATQELDSLLAEFVEDEGMGVAVTDSVEKPNVGVQDYATDVDHGATQELDSLLGQFSDDIAESDASMEHGATQVLSSLLDEFDFDDEDDQKG